MDGVPNDIFCMEEPNYIMKIMSTYDGLIVKDGQRESKRQYEKDGELVQKTFQYCEPFSNHFDFRHCIDDHNNLRHQLPAIEATWTTHRWACRVFAFILGVVEVNCFLAFKYFVWDGKERKTLDEFRTDMACALIDNDYLKREMWRDKEQETWKVRRKLNEHRLVSAPCYAVNWDGKKWEKKGRLKYMQFTCKMEGCKKPVRTYCLCNMGSWLCKDCLAEHVIKVNM